MKDTGQGELVSEGYASLMAIDQRSSANEAIRRWWRAIARFELWFCGLPRDDGHHARRLLRSNNLFEFCQQSGVGFD
jgi:hypothetical protein